MPKPRKLYGNYRSIWQLKRKNFAARKIAKKPKSALVRSAGLSNEVKPTSRSCRRSWMDCTHRSALKRVATRFRIGSTTFLSIARFRIGVLSCLTEDTTTASGRTAFVLASIGCFVFQGSCYACTAPRFANGQSLSASGTIPRITALQTTLKGFHLFENMLCS